MTMWQKLGKKVVHVNPWWSLEEHAVIRPNGKRDSYFMIHAEPFCAIIPITEQNEIYLVKQFRYPLQRSIWELPMGMTDGHKDLVATAQRELAEETGLSADEWHEVGTLPSDKGATDEIGHVFVAKQLTQTGVHEQAEEGIEACQAFPLAEVKDMIRRGDLFDDFSVAALYLAELHGHLG